MYNAPSEVKDQVLVCMKIEQTDEKLNFEIKNSKYIKKY